MHIAHSEQAMMSAVPAIAGAAFVAAASALPALCPFRVWSGHACPLCGMTRAAGSLTTGDVTMALRYHPLVMLLALEALVIGVFYARTRSQPSPVVVSWLAGINVISFVVVWLMRWRLGLLSFVVN